MINSAFYERERYGPVLAMAPTNSFNTMANIRIRFALLPKGRRLLTPKGRLVMKNAFAPLKWRFRTNYRHPGKNSKNGVMSVYATIRQEPTRPGRAGSGSVRWPDIAC